MEFITILPGFDKDGKQEEFERILMRPGELIAIVGNTGSGKSRLMKDLEQIACKDTVTGRTVLIDGEIQKGSNRPGLSAGLMAHLGQNMKFTLDVSVHEFLLTHMESRGRDLDPKTVIETANQITPEWIFAEDHLNLLSGGQSRALMIADIAMICDSPVVLIDEIENAGIDKEKALKLLVSKDKLVLLATHDPHTALMAKKRIVMQKGAVTKVLERNGEELKLFEVMQKEYQQLRFHQIQLRKGEYLV